MSQLLPHSRSSLRPQPCLGHFARFVLLLCGLPFALAAGDHELPKCAIVTLPVAVAPCTFGDYDGDQRPDFAVTDPIPHGAAVSVRLFGAESPQLLNANGRLASGLASRDVDGDHDLDLILTRGLHVAVAVFLNDGYGNFSFDSDDNYLRQVGLDLDPAVDPAPPPIALDPAEDRPSLSDSSGGPAGAYILAPRAPRHCFYATPPAAAKRHFHRGPAFVRAP